MDSKTGAKDTVRTRYLVGCDGAGGTVPLALGVLAARIKDKQIHEQQAKMAATRKSLIGSGDRSERIRTYNFPQGRVTDHRINLTLYKIERILDGELDELVAGLLAADRAERLAQLAEESG